MVFQFNTNYVNNIDLSGARISRSPEFSVVNSTEIALNIRHKDKIIVYRVYARNTKSLTVGL